MSDEEFRDISATVITPLTESQLAEWRREGGAHVVCHKGRYWHEVFRGFYEPVHWMARLEAAEATRPVTWCWGFRASLREGAASAANGTMSMHLLSDLSDYSMETLPGKRRTDLRKCRKQVSVVQLTGAKVLEEQGYEVDLSAMKRTRHGQLPDREHYLATVSRMPTDPRNVVLAGMVQGKLGGYLIGHAVDDVAYVETLRIATEYLSTAMGTGLAFDFVQICKRSAAIRHVVYGLHSIEDSALVFFKEGMGFVVAPVPIRVWICPILRTLIRWRNPAKFYRLTGLGADALKNRGTEA